MLPTGDGFIAVLPLFQSVIPQWLLDFVVKMGDEARKPEKFEIRVGLHVGDALAIHIGDGANLDLEPADAQLKPNNFISYDMNYVARLTSCANPGQIVASDDFVRRVHSTLVSNPLYALWWEKFTVSFKGDVVSYTSDGRAVPKAGMVAARPFAEDKRDVHSILILKDESTPFGNMRVPLNALSFLGSNNYHAKFIGDRLPRTTFQLVPDVELFALYADEAKNPIISWGPFFIRLPFTVLYEPTRDRMFNIAIQTDEAITWAVAKEGGDVVKAFGGIKKTEDDIGIENNELCSLTACEPLRNGFLLSYAPCWYAQSFETVISPDRCSGQSATKSLRQRLALDVPDHKRALPQLADRRLTAHIGVTAIVFSGDNRPIIQFRESANLHSNINSASASVSGAVDWADRTNAKAKANFDIKYKKNNEKHLVHITYQKIAALFNGRELMPADYGIIREAVEEIFLLPDDIRSIELVGVAREFRRVGKPEFFYLIHSNKLIHDTFADAEAYAPFKWEWGGKLKSAIEYDPLPDDPVEKCYYLSNLCVDAGFNEITRLAFYFIFKKILATNL